MNSKSVCGIKRGFQFSLQLFFLHIFHSYKIFRVTFEFESCGETHVVLHVKCPILNKKYVSKTSKYEASCKSVELFSRHMWADKQTDGRPGRYTHFSNFLLRTQRKVDEQFYTTEREWISSATITLVPAVESVVLSAAVIIFSDK